MLHKHIVVLRGMDGSRVDKPVVIAGCDTKIGSCLRAFIPVSKGLYFKVAARNIGMFMGDGRPCRSVRAMREDELPSFVCEVGGDQMLTVLYGDEGYRALFGEEAPSYMHWCLGMLSGMFLVELHHSVHCFLKALKGKPRPRAAVESAAMALLPYTYAGKGRTGRWVELEFNGMFLKGDVHAAGSSMPDMAEAVAGMWKRMVERANGALEGAKA